MNASSEHSPPARRIRSFVLRGGRMTAAQQRAFDSHWPLWGLEHKHGPVNFEASFGREGPLILEIGFGMGQSLLQMAAASPQNNYIGVEVHRAGVGRLLLGMADRDVDNIRIYRHDAVEVLRDCIGPDSLDCIQIFFPDPWHKKRHHKRRLIQPGFVKQLSSCLKSGGSLHLATDWQPYAKQMMDVLSACDSLVNSRSDGEFAARPSHRPQTHFEQRGARLGHGIWDLIFLRSGAA